MKLNTVNITEVIDSSISQVFSYTNDEAGIKEAEEMFAKLAKENGMDDEDLDDALDDGYWNDDGENAYNVFVTHSS